MVIINLQRAATGPSGTFGRLWVNSWLLADTLELPWNDNQRNVSCVPAGVYQWVRRAAWFNAERYGDTIEIICVPNRSGILFHPANLVSELRGCVTYGERGRLDGKPAVLKSGSAHRRLMSFLHAQDTGLVIIKEAW